MENLNYYWLWLDCSCENLAINRYAINLCILEMHPYTKHTYVNMAMDDDGWMFIITYMLVRYCALILNVIANYGWHKESKTMTKFGQMWTMSSKW